MRIKWIVLISALCFLFSCNDSEPLPTLEVSETNLSVTNQESTQEIDITSTSAWKVESSAPWCISSKRQGENNGTIVLHISQNITPSSRAATVTVTADNTPIIIQIVQEAGQVTDEYKTHYKLPVIFHVLYKNKNNANQYVLKERLVEELAAVNKLYKSANMNLEFVLAANDPDGNILDEPGIERVAWTKEYPIDCDNFMNDSRGTYTDLLWDPNLYINIMMYNFKTEDGSNMVTLGISHLPYTPSANNLEGLTNSSPVLKLENLKYAYCLSINSLFIGPKHQSTATTYNPADITTTLAHELGHYLGLFHTFAENNKTGGLLNVCKDTDYCKDTESYAKPDYDRWIEGLDFNQEYTLKFLAQRNNCDGVEFISRNIMDYSYSYTDEFTDDQRTRVRHVLSYSPLIPGPKMSNPNTRSISGPMDLPISVLK